MMISHEPETLLTANFRTARESAAGPRVPTILHIEDERLFRELISIQVQSMTGMKVRMLSAATGTDGVALASLHRPDLVILDLQLPDLDGFAVATKLRHQPQPPRILLLTGASLTKNIGRFASLRVEGIARKGSLEVTEFEHAIKELLAGRRYIQKEMQSLISANASRVSLAEKILSDREIELLALLGLAMSDAEVAMIKGLSSETVRTHRQNIMRKLGLHSLGGLVRWATSNGYADFDRNMEKPD